MTEPRPSLRPTSVASLFVAFLAGAALTWLLVDRYYGSMPNLTWWPAMTLGLLALAEVYAAITTRARIRREPGADALEPLTVARYAVLAKASSLVGALFTGVYGALALWLGLAADRLTAASGDLPGALLGFGASVALLVAAVWLEYSCRIPERKDREDEESRGSGSAGGGGGSGESSDE